MIVGVIRDGWNVEDSVCNCAWPTTKTIHLSYFWCYVVSYRLPYELNFTTRENFVVSPLAMLLCMCYASICRWYENAKCSFTELLSAASTVSLQISSLDMDFHMFHKLIIIGNLWCRSWEKCFSYVCTFSCTWCSRRLENCWEDHTRTAALYQDECPSSQEFGRVVKMPTVL